MKYKLLLFFIAVSAFSVKAQTPPEKFSNDFVNCFLNFKESCAKNFIAGDSVAQKVTFDKLRTLYESEIKENVKGKLGISSSTRAILKDGDAKHKEIADIIIQIELDKDHRYKMILWGCYAENEKWYLGEKIEMKKL
ncbi:MAG: hypothetical protein ACJ77K_18235 [Bacteroidia bacterium]|jgi:hypothetical protein